MRREEAAEVALAGLLPGSRLTQCSHREELVEPAEKGGHEVRPDGRGLTAHLGPGTAGQHEPPDPCASPTAPAKTKGWRAGSVHVCSGNMSAGWTIYNAHPSPKGWQQNRLQTIVTFIPSHVFTEYYTQTVPATH